VSDNFAVKLVETLEADFGMIMNIQTWAFSYILSQLTDLLTEQVRSAVMGLAKIAVF
jgi:hypothetical protein